MSDEDKTVVIAPSKLAGKKEPAPKAKLICEDDSLLTGPIGRQIALHMHEITIGRGEENKVPIKAKSISRVHARAFPGDGMWGLEDLGSTNGVQVNGVKVTQTWLKDRDKVMIGKVPYSFELERPEISDSASDPDNDDPNFDPTATMVDKTMMVSSDVRAAAALLRSAQKDQTEADDAPPPPRPSRSAAAHQSADAEKKGGAGKWIAIAAVILIAAGAGLYFADITGAGKRSSAIESLVGEVAAFEKANPNSDSYSKGAFEEGLSRLGQLSPKVAAAVRDYPDAAELLELQAKVSFLTAERNLVLGVEEGGVKQSRGEVQAALSGYEAAMDALTAAGGQPNNMTTELGDLLQLTLDVAKIKVFMQSYPDPTDVANKPTRNLFDDVMIVRRSFASLKKRHNLALSVTYPYLGAIVDDMDEKDINVLDKWNRVLK